MSSKDKPLLWEDWMTVEDYRVRKEFYQTPGLLAHASLDEAIPLPSPDHYLDIGKDAVLLDTCTLTYRYLGDTDYDWCDVELFQYSLYGVSSIDFEE